MNENTLMVVGNLTDAPELRYTPSGAAMAKFRLASTPRVRDAKTGAWRDGEPLFLTCTAWRELAEHAAESLSKGARVLVVGRLRLAQWKTPEGDRRSMHELQVDELGPSLRWATATVHKMTRTRAGDGFTPDDAPDDAWNTATPAAVPSANAA